MNNIDISGWALGNPYPDGYVEPTDPISDLVIALINNGILPVEDLPNSLASLPMVALDNRIINRG